MNFFLYLQDWPGRRSNRVTNQTVKKRIFFARLGGWAMDGPRVAEITPPLFFCQNVAIFFGHFCVDLALDDVLAFFGFFLLLTVYHSLSGSRPWGGDGIGTA